MNQKQYKLEETESYQCRSYISEYHVKMNVDKSVYEYPSTAENLWHYHKDTNLLEDRLSFDVHFSTIERLPRMLKAQLIETSKGMKPSVRTLVNGMQIGNELTDNAYREDGYRYHDVFHLSYAAILGWSPVMRKFLKCKRKSDSEIDAVEDGGRARLIEESISHTVFTYAGEHNFFRGAKAVNKRILKDVRRQTAHLEVSHRSLQDWEKAILLGYDVWRKMMQNRGGVVIADLNSQSLEYKELQC